MHHAKKGINAPRKSVNLTIQSVSITLYFSISYNPTADM